MPPTGLAGPFRNTPGNFPQNRKQACWDARADEPQKRTPPGQGRSFHDA